MQQTNRQQPIWAIQGRCLWRSTREAFTITLVSYMSVYVHPWSQRPASFCSSFKTFNRSLTWLSSGYLRCLKEANHWHDMWLFLGYLRCHKEAKPAQSSTWWDASLSWLRGTWGHNRWTLEWKLYRSQCLLWKRVMKWLFLRLKKTATVSDGRLN